MKIEPPKINIIDGLVAFFDIMGFSEMLASNEPKKLTPLSAMKSNQLAWMLVIFLEATAFQLLAQQTAITTNGFFQVEAEAKAGNANAQFSLGMYYKQIGDTAASIGMNAEGGANYVQAFKWLCLAADHSNFSLVADARRNLSIIMTFPWMTSEQVEEAKELVRTIAPDAVAKVEADIITDKQKQFEADKTGAENGNPMDQELVAVDYTLGEGVSKDDDEAAKWYRRSAMQGNSLGENSFAGIYERGVGVPQNYVEAYKWYNLAAAQGFEPAQEDRNRLALKMTPNQIAEAQELSSEFKPREESGSNNSTSPENPTASGTGFFITDDGYLISNYHVVKDAIKVRLVMSAGTMDAKVVQVDAANDLALLKTDIPAPPAGYVLKHGFSSLPIAVSRTVALGDTVFTLGFPDPGLQGFAPKFGKGEIAALAGAGDDARYFQISVPVQPGNSGGALVDEHGNVVGIVSAKLDAATALAASGALPENVNYAIKSSYLLSFLESVPDVDTKLKPSNTQDEKFEDAVKDTQAATVLVLVY